MRQPSWRKVQGHSLDGLFGSSSDSKVLQSFVYGLLLLLMYMRSAKQSFSVLEKVAVCRTVQPECAYRFYVFETVCVATTVVPWRFDCLWSSNETVMIIANNSFAAKEDL